MSLCVSDRLSACSPHHRVYQHPPKPLTPTVVTLWYFPYFELLSDGLRAAIARPREWTGWDDAARGRLADLVPVYAGDAEPVTWNREPGELLQ